MARSLAAGAARSGLVQRTDEVEEDDHDDRHACQPKNDIAEHCCLSQVVFKSSGEPAGAGRSRTWRVSRYRGAVRP